MVMHARKQPRLNDGYSDRKGTHLHQDMQYHSNVFTDNADDNGHLSSRDSPRYQNKPSYIERNKEKRGSLSLAEKKVSHYLATGSLGRPIPMEASFSLEGDGQQNTSDPSAHRSAVPSSSASHHHPSGIRKERSSSQGDRLGPNTRDYSTYSSSSSKPLPSSHYHQHPSEQLQQSKNPPATQHQHHVSEQNSHFEKDICSTKTALAKQNSKDKEQVQKSAIRVCGDWSEHISSSGKRYYYNCKTEVSQWEKPKEWSSELCKTPDHRAKDGKSKLLSQTPASKINPDNRSARHSINLDQQQHDHSRSHHRVNSSDMSESSRDSFHQQRDNKDIQMLGVRENQQQTTARENKESGQCSRDQLYKMGYDKNRPGDRDLPVNSTSAYQVYTGRSSVVLTGNNNGMPTEERESQLHNADSRKLGPDISSQRRRNDSQGRYPDAAQEAMDISPSSSLSPSQPGSINGTSSQLPLTANTIPSASALGTPGSSSINIRSSSPQQGNPIPTLVNRQAVPTAETGGNFDKTIQTLQELHKALSMSIHRAQHGAVSSAVANVTQVTGTATNQTSPYPGGMPAIQQQPPIQPHTSHQHHHPVTTQQQHQGMKEDEANHTASGGRASPVSETSRSSTGSPTPSDTSSQNAVISQQALNAAVPMKNEETAKLTASLSNYYNESLISHVLGWQADALEKQASKLWEETMVNGSLQCSQISVDLKKARSFVRIAEIQSTLHEQRIMSSDQQRQEIENLKTPSSFLPS